MKICLVNFFKFLLDNISIITAIILGVTLFLASRKSKRERITLGVQTLYDLQDKYKSSAIDNAKTALLQGYNAVCGGNRERWVKHYFDLKKTQADLDNHRKVYSHFYQKLAHFHAKRIVTKDLLFPAWSWDDLEMLGEIIIPIEEQFPKPSKRALNNLHKLYKHFKNWQKRDIKRSDRDKTA